MASTMSTMWGSRTTDRWLHSRRRTSTSPVTMCRRHTDGSSRFSLPCTTSARPVYGRGRCSRATRTPSSSSACASAVGEVLTTPASGTRIRRRHSSFRGSGSYVVVVVRDGSARLARCSTRGGTNVSTTTTRSTRCPSASRRRAAAGRRAGHRAVSPVGRGQEPAPGVRADSREPDDPSCSQVPKSRMSGYADHVRSRLGRSHPVCLGQFTCRSSFGGDQSTTPP